MEAAIVERLRRSENIKLHPQLINAPLIYDEMGQKALLDIYREYAEVAYQSSLPILLCSPTWRANYERVKNSEFPTSINIDTVNFLKNFKDSLGEQGTGIKIGGLIGCKNDCYKPDEGLSVSESQKFHSWQINQLALAQVDFLIAQTLPSIEEAAGIAKAMATTGVPYIISFVINRDGVVLDGTKLVRAVKFIDSQTKIKPIGYMVNCAYPSFLCPEKQEKELFDYLIGYLANASSLDHCELDGALHLHTELVSEWGDLMLELNEKYGVKILGGCCGTNSEYLRYITKE